MQGVKAVGESSAHSKVAPVASELKSMVPERWSLGLAGGVSIVVFGKTAIVTVAVSKPLKPSLTLNVIESVPAKPGFGV